MKPAWIFNRIAVLLFPINLLAWMSALRAAPNPTNLWLGIAPASNSVMLTLRDTTPGSSYQILSRPGISSGPWAIEQNVLGSEGQDHTEITVPMNGRPSLFFSASPGGASLWLEIQSTNASLRLILHGTAPGVPYQILSKSRWESTWVVEQDLVGVSSQDWTVTIIPPNGRSMIFFTAGSSQDSDGDGLPDATEHFITHTEPLNSDAANSGVSDGYQDFDGDGWTNIEEVQNQTDPGAFDTPPAPRGFDMSFLDANRTIILLEWELSSGATGYCVERDSGAGFVEIANLGPTELSYTDHLPVSAPRSYRIRANYALGASLPSSIRNSDRFDPSIIAPVAIVRGPAGKVFVVVWGFPTNFSTLGVYLIARPILYDGQPFFPNPGSGALLVPVQNFNNGMYEILGQPTAQYGFYEFYATWYRNDGSYGPLLAGPQKRVIRFIDGSEALRDNLSFLVRAARGNANPHLGINPAYVSTGFWEPETNVPDELLPFEQNYLFRNWIYDPTDLDQNGYFITGVHDDEFTGGMIGDTKYGFPVYQYVTSNDPTLLASQLAPATSSHIYLQWLIPSEFDFYPPQDAGLSVSIDGQYIGMANDARNLFGVSVASTRISNTGFFKGLADLFPGGQLHETNATGEFFQQVDQPVLETMNYYFARPGLDPMPGDASFSLANTTPLIVTSLGQPLTIAGWAKQRIVNGDATRFAYLGQYFDKAFKADPATGQRTTNETGVLSEYGEFFPTEPGLKILTTQTDPGQANSPGECRVHVIALCTDLSRDGTIDPALTGPDTTSPTRPFRFWVNDDDDSGETGGKDISGVTSAGADAFPTGGIGPSVVDGVRDLIDFFPVHLNIRSLLRALPLGPIECTLKQADNALNFVYTDLKRDEIRNYLTETEAARSLASASTIQVLASGSDVGAGFLQTIGAEDKGVILVEARRKTSQPLILEVKKDGQVIVQTELHITIDSVETMFRHKNLIWDVTPNQRDGPAHRLTDASVPNEPETNAKNFVFLHGYNVNSEQARGSFAETFKRMYWSGSHAKFYGVTWYGSDTQGNLIPGVTCNYHTNVYHAFQTAPYLANFLATLTNGPTVLAAHSLGNMVCLSAIRFLISKSDQIVSQIISSRH